MLHSLSALSCERGACNLRHRRAGDCGEFKILQGG